MESKNLKLLMALVLCGSAGASIAGEKDDLLLLKNTTINLIEELVKQGVLTQKTADQMVQNAKAEAEAEAGQQKKTAEQVAKPVEPGDVRVSYVPQFVKDEIRQQVRTELREEVVGDVMQKAKSEKWGLPEALPDWVNRFKLSGDLRLRSQNEFMSDDNADGETAQLLNFQAINQRGGRLGNFNDYLNTTKDRHRFRQRFRLGLDAKITDNFKAGIRLATGNQPDPVSTNQSLGITGSQYEFNVDRAYLKYDVADEEGFKWLTLTGGRIANPWYVGGGEFTGGSELVWDTDLSFEGFAATGRYSLGSAKEALGKHDASREIYATAGAFPLEETELSSSGKWLVGGQVGLDWGFANQDAFRMGVAYYDYINTRAKPNNKASRTCDNNDAANTFSIPQYLQFGNTLVGICNNGNVDDPGTIPQLFGLASDYNIVNVNMAYDWAMFAPYHLVASADFAKNVGFNKASVNALNPVNNKDDKIVNPGEDNTGSKTVSDETNAWQVRLDFGWPKAESAGHWNVFALYKYVERDAVFDAFSDSDFHLGGTNAKGWVIGGNYGLMKNVWLTGRWLSTDTISGPRYGIDTLQLDLNAKF
jgi:Putative porin